MKSSLVILTFNEIEGVKTLFDKIPFDKFDECFVVDGGSKDGTIEFFKERGIKQVLQDKKGRGEAFQIAARAAQGDILVFFSPDGNENPQDAVKLKEAVEQGFDMAVASRFMAGAKSENSGEKFPVRNWGNRFFTFLVNKFFKGNLTDAINGFRAIRKDKFAAINPDAPGFAIEYQISMRALKKGMKIKEIPTTEGERIGGKSTAKTIPTGWKLLKMLVREIKLGENF